LAVLLVDLSSPARSVCSSTIFRDGFESGDTSRWGNSTAPLRADGTWRFSIDFGGSDRPFAIELVERVDHALVGYVYGGTADRSLIGGSVAGSAISFDLELVNPAATRTITLAGTLGRDSMALTASGDVATQAVSVERLPCDVVEQQLLAGDLSGGPQPQHLRELAVVLDDEGAFVSGGYVGLDDCLMWDCDGGVTSFSDVADVLTIGLETDGGCSAGSSLTGTWDSGSGLYAGSFSFTDCADTTTGSAIAAYGMGTSSVAAREALAGRAAIADLVETDTPLVTLEPALAAGYLNFGKDEPTLRAELNAEISAWDNIEVVLSRPRSLYTAQNARTLPDLVQPFGWAVDELRRGVPAGGGSVTVYRDTAHRPLIDDLGGLGLDGGRWKITGNQEPGLDLPFAYTIPGGGSRLEAPTADGSPVYVSLGPYGAHFQPLTGHPSGDAKANLVGFLAADDSELEELVGNGNGIREPGEVWGYPLGGDLSGDRVRQRRPVYRAPADGVVYSVVYEEAPTGTYFDNEPKWRVDLRLASGVELDFGHVGAIAPALAAQVLSLTGVDPSTFSGPAGTDLLAGYAPIAVSTGDPLALPQILADPVPGHPGYYQGGGSFLDIPWAQMEVFVPYHVGSRESLGGDFCIYRFMTPAHRAELQAVMDLDMTDPQSQRYRDQPWLARWMWSAQGGLCQAENPLPKDFSSLYTWLGGWAERPESGTTPDELFSFVPIDRESAAYDVSNYDSAAVDHLVIRNLWPGPYSWTMPDASTANPFFPVGEVLSWNSSSLLLKWRDLNPTNAVVYQRAAYLLDASGLKIEWGNFAATAGGATLPTLLPGDPCDDSTILCYQHALSGWPP